MLVVYFNTFESNEISQSFMTLEIWPPLDGVNEIQASVSCV